MSYSVPPNQIKNFSVHFMDFSETARKQHFYLDGTKRSSKAEKRGKRENRFFILKNKPKNICERLRESKIAVLNYFRIKVNMNSGLKQI